LVSLSPRVRKSTSWMVRVRPSSWSTLLWPRVDDSSRTDLANCRPLWDSLLLWSDAIGELSFFLLKLRVNDFATTASFFGFHLLFFTDVYIRFIFLVSFSSISSIGSSSGNLFGIITEPYYRECSFKPSSITIFDFIEFLIIINYYRNLLI
jgi:hypothetical protein